MQIKDIVSKNYFGIIYLIIAALLSTAALLLFVLLFSRLPLIYAFFSAIVLWAPANWLFTKAQTKVKDISIALIVFSIASTITDTFGGLIVQHTPIKNILSLIIGLGAGIAVISIGAKSKDFDQPSTKKELVLYIVGGASVLFAIVLKDVWYVLVASYAITDLFGASLVLRLLRYINEHKKSGWGYEVLIGLCSFVPTTFVAVLLLKVIDKIAIVGPTTTILTCGVALVGSKLLSNKYIKIKDVAFLLLSVACVYLIFTSF